MKQIILYTGIALILVTNSFAQQFDYTSQLKKAKETSYHQILLSPELLGKTKKELVDLRIYDTQNTEIPYFIKRGELLSTQFKEYKILKKAYKKDAISHLVFHNPQKKKINNVSFLVRNTDVQKRARLSGSNDQKNWYVIKNNYLLHSMKSNEKTTELNILNFPLSNYEYFKLEIDDNWRLPINILKVGYYDTEEVKESETSFEWNISSQKDSAKVSYIQLKSPNPLYIEKLQLSLSGSEFYLRDVRIYAKKEKFDKKGETVSYYKQVGRFRLNSNSDNKVELKAGAYDELYLEIENQDNPPLKVERVQGSYLNYYLVAKLDTATTYELKFGNTKILAPQYDIKNFANQLPKELPQISHLEIVQTKEVVEAKEESIFESPYFIWTLIGLVGIGLVLISVNMLKEMNKKND